MQLKTFIYSRSTRIGRFRVLISSKVMKFVNTTNKIKIRFHGRGEGYGSYRVTRATVAIRSGTSLNIAAGSAAADITVDGQSSFDVPEYGIITDDVTIR